MFYLPQYALPYLRKTEGNIINDSSLVAQIGQQGAVTYVATKVCKQISYLMARYMIFMVQPSLISESSFYGNEWNIFNARGMTRKENGIMTRTKTGEK